MEDWEKKMPDVDLVIVIRHLVDVCSKSKSKTELCVTRRFL
jgi:hypothetical protein